jgi:hypothetical protein
MEDRILVGAYDPAQINGLVFIGNDQNFFGIRFLAYRPGADVEEVPQLFEFGPHAADGSYAAVSWRPPFDDQNPVDLRWSRLSKTVVIGRLTAPSNVRVAMEVYRPWSVASGDESRATFLAQPDRRTILGEQVQNQGNESLLRRFVLRTDRAAVGAASYENTEALRKMLLKDGHAQPTGQPEKPGLHHQAALSFDFSQDQSFSFIAMVGDNFEGMEREADKLLQKPIAESLDRAEKNYDSTRTASSGAIGESFEAISRLVNWNRFYNPEKKLEYVTIHRLPKVQRTKPSVTDEDSSLRGNVISWDTLFTATLAAMVDAGSAKTTVRAVLEGQMPDGRMPLRRHLQNQPRFEPATLAGRSMPPIGALCVWKVYLATNDLGLLAWAYPRLLRWNDWWLANRSDGQAWRDGNGDGLLEWGYDAELEHGALGARNIRNSVKTKLALSESGLDVRPQWNNGEETGTNSANPAKLQDDEVKYNDVTHTLEFTSVALNALYTLDTEILLLMARELGLPSEADKIQVRYDRIRNLINDKLWSEEDGLYLNRHWDGRFSRRLSLENFYILIAGLADEERAKRIMKTLSDPKKFWGEQPLAFIPRDDPAFMAIGEGRGAIWSLSNYLVYTGLRRYGFHDEAALLARKSSNLARTSWEKAGKFHDHYSSSDGRGIEKNKALQDSSLEGLMFWAGIEEIISGDLWTGLSVGSLSVTEESSIERLAYSNTSFDVISGPKRTILRRSGKIEFECEGPVRLRAYRVTDRTISFVIETKERVRILVPAIEGRKITVSIDEKVLGSTSPGAAASFRVPAGNHKVIIVK